jgi:hypothetical protein
VTGLANDLDALFDLLALRGQALVLTTGRFEGLVGLLKTHRFFLRTARARAVRAACLRSQDVIQSDQVVLEPRWSPCGQLALWWPEGTHGFAVFMLAMEHVGRVMRSPMMVDIGQNPRGFITGGLNHLTVKLSQGGRHELIPGVLIAALRELSQDNEVADWLGDHQAQTAGHRDGFVGHILGQVRDFSVAVVDDGVVHLTVDLLLRHRRRRQIGLDS